MINLVIYTAIFGNYDILKPPKIINPDVKYICFTDKIIECPPWEIVVVNPEFQDSRRENRKYKILSHKYFPGFEYSIYIDGNFIMMRDLSKYVKKWLDNNDIAVLKHPKRRCLYDEAEYLILIGGEKEILRSQINRYKAEGYPKHNGLTANRLIIRKHTEKIKQFNEAWWNEVKNNSHRDQISFLFIMYKCKINYSIIPIKSRGYFAQRYFKVVNHNQITPP